MSYASRFIGECLRHGDAFTVSSVTGTVCPCMTSRSTNPAYSPEWHINNPSASACNGTGLISRTTATINLKGFFYPAAILSRNQVPENVKSVIGEVDQDDLILYGQVNTDTNTFYDISGITELDDSLTYDAVTYVRRNTYDLKISDRIAQVSIVKRKA